MWTGRALTRWGRPLWGRNRPSPIEPPWWPYWGWGWRGLQRAGPTLSAGLGVGFLLAVLAYYLADQTVVTVAVLVPLALSWSLCLVLVLWAHPKRLIPPWARSQSGALREWSDWWKLRRHPGRIS